jgi:hypothetical protein
VKDKGLVWRYINGWNDSFTFKKKIKSRN